MTEGTPHQALYRRWRAQTFSEMVGQEAVVATLRNAVATGKVSHALLFTGPRGTGKTSLARIVAKAINCENLGPNADPCDTCPSCVAIREGRALDLVEIDAASNRGIDAIRDLRERLNYAPTDLRRKVYILDEAHQITKDAWNALLKSLEEPPDFVTFMFASTHPQEFPPAILSRLQRFDVRRLTVGEITGKLERILAADGRDAEPEAVALVARLAAGGMRDAESILDQLLASTSARIEADAVRDLLGLADADLVDGFVDALATGTAAAGIGILDRLEERGRDLRIFLDQVVDAIRERLLAALGTPAAADPSLAVAARRLASIDPTRLGPGGIRLQLELALLDPRPGGAVAPSVAAPSRPAATAPVARGDGPADPAPAAARAERAPAPPSRAPARARTQQPVNEPANATDARRAAAAAAAGADASEAVPASPPASVAVPAPATDSATAGPAGESRPAVDGPPPSETPGPAASAPPAGGGDDLDRLRNGWVSVVTTITDRNRAVKPLITACRPIGVEGNVVTLGFPEEQGFLKDVADRRRPLLEECIGAFLGHDVAVRCVATNLDLLPPLPDDAEAAHILAEAHRIFAEDLAEVPEVT
ncbi:MAG TPA: DNA polymerase III subunit gamma/tau [Candidatus Limnocylindrales bacterium]|nr:DNA polymerase III subunit gamma/tau [Candidatus Limnocylindrales bacterium]